MDDLPVVSIYLEDNSHEDDNHSTLSGSTVSQKL